MKLVPVWRIAEKVLSDRGTKPSPRLILRLCEKVTEDINIELAQEQKEIKKT